MTLSIEKWFRDARRARNHKLESLFIPLSQQVTTGSGSACFGAQPVAVLPRHAEAAAKHLARRINVYFFSQSRRSMSRPVGQLGPPLLTRSMTACRFSPGI